LLGSDGAEPSSDADHEPPNPLMSIKSGAHELGPENARLQVKTERRGAAAIAGHDLTIDVTSWEGVLDVGESPERFSLNLRVDPRSLQVREGTGGVQALGEEDKVEIKQTIEDEVLGSQPIEFHSTEAEPLDGERRLRVRGELTMNGNTHPLDFVLNVNPEGQLSGHATVTQSDWGIEPYSGLFGTLKVRDEVEVVAEASFPG
jgi:polyisoprenoid-binding protein YceI